MEENNQPEIQLYGWKSIMPGIILSLIVLVCAGYMLLNRDVINEKVQSTITGTLEDVSEDAASSSSSTVDAPSPTPPTVAGFHENCTDRACAADLTCIEYYGIAGPNGPLFATCEMPCTSNQECPGKRQCVTIADGPGQVCSS